VNFDNADCIVVRCACCQRVIYAAVNEPRVIDFRARNEIGEMVAEGCTVEHMPAEKVREQMFGCKHPYKRPLEQATMPLKP
jgi:hypothetical protein